MRQEILKDGCQKTISSPLDGVELGSSCIKAERFKTRAAHFPIWHDEQTGMQRPTLGKSGSKAASQLKGRIARAFSSNSLVKTMKMTAVIQ